MTISQKMIQYNPEKSDFTPLFFSLTLIVTCDLLILNVLCYISLSPYLIVLEERQCSKGVFSVNICIAAAFDLDYFF